MSELVTSSAQHPPSIRSCTRCSPSRMVQVPSPGQEQDKEARRRRNLSSPFPLAVGDDCGTPLTLLAGMGTPSTALVLNRHKGAPRQS